jgi:hypothetical protein
VQSKIDAGDAPFPLTDITTQSLKGVGKKVEHTAQASTGNDDLCWTILWLVPCDWELYYIRDILQGLAICTEIREKLYSDDMELSNRTILVTSQRLETRPHRNEHTMQRLRALNYTFAVFLLSEESPPESKSCSTPEISAMIDQSSLLIRNYWTHDCHNQEKVLTVPLFVTVNAYKSGYRESCGDHFGKEASQRKTLLYFASRHRIASRTTFVESIQNATHHSDANNQVKLLYGNYDMKIEPFGQSLSDTKYAAVVMGNVEETWRFTESLFCGAIPFMERRVYHYYQHWLPLSLMDLIPYYENDNPTSIQNEFDKLVRETPEEYVKHATAIRTAAKDWFDNDVREMLILKLRQISQT